MKIKIKPSKKNAPERKAVEAQEPGAATPSAEPASPEPGIIPNHPLAEVIGIFADDPDWEEFRESVRQARREMEEQEPAGSGTPL